MEFSFKLATNMRQNINFQIYTDQIISVTRRWKCSETWQLPLLDLCQIEKCFSLLPVYPFWGISELSGMFAPASDPVMKYARAELCWQRWALLSLDERELLGWHGRNLRQHLSDGCHQHLDSTLSEILWWTWCRGLSFHHRSFVHLTFSLSLIWMLSSVFPPLS